MGTAATQGELWGVRATDWIELQEATVRPVYEDVLTEQAVGPATNILDIGCGSGLFCEMAAARGASITGVDASAPLVALAKARLPSADIRTGEMEQLPFQDASFDLSTGFNSFQYAQSPDNALREAARVTRRNGVVIMMVWGAPESCQASAYLKAVGSLLPAPPPGTPGPFALSTNSALESLVERAGMKVVAIREVQSDWYYASMDKALRGMLSAGPAVKAIRQSGEEAARKAVLAAIQGFQRSDGSVFLKNSYRYIVARP